MSDTNIWDINISGGDVIALIVSGQWFTGPFAPGEVVQVATVQVKNIGSVVGDMFGQPFFYPGQPNEIEGTKTLKYDIQPGAIWGYMPVVQIPANAPPGGTIPVGVKVWGETELEPTWSLMANLPISSQVFY